MVRVATFAVGVATGAILVGVAVLLLGPWWVPATSELVPPIPRLSSDGPVVRNGVVAIVACALNWVYAEENYVSIGYQVEDLKDNRQVAGHPAELQPLLGFGYGKPTPREKEYFKKYNLGTDIVALTDERGTKFRMVDNSMATSGGPKPVEGPLENLVAFKPKEGLKPSKEHDFRLQVPLYESASLGCK